MGLEIVLNTTFNNPGLPIAPPPIGFVDTFNRANSATIGTTSDGNRTWPNAAGWAIVNNELKFTGTTDSPLWIDIGTSNFEATIDYTELSGDYPTGFLYGTKDSTYTKIYRASGSWIVRNQLSQPVGPDVATPLTVGTLTIVRNGDNLTLQGVPISFTVTPRPTGNWFAITGNANQVQRINKITVAGL